MARLPESANIVVIGQGGIVGASVVHHLAELGWDGIVGLDKSQIPTDVGSTSHASDFCFTTTHGKLEMFTTTYSQRFYERLGCYLKRGGMEVARVGDDERMQELERKVGSGKAFGSNVHLISPREASERFPLVNEDAIQGALWDPDAGLVVPRSQRVVADLVAAAEESGALRPFANTPATGIEVAAGRVRGVHTTRGFIEAPRVIVCAGIWGPVVAAMAGAELPLMAVEHPLLFFGPLDTLEGTGTELVYPLFRDQANSAYARDTGDPTTTEGGMLEWGYYEQHEPRLVSPWEIKELGTDHLSPSMHELSMDQILEPYERAVELMPILGEVGWDSRGSFNGLLSITPDGEPVIGEAPEARGLWFGEAVWIKNGPGIGKLLADWMTRGMPHVDPHAIDAARFYPLQKTREYVRGRSRESACKIYAPPIHPREPYESGRELRRGPFWPRETELGGYFMEAAGWERAHGYEANEARLAEYRERVPARQHEWDARHFWEVSNAEHLAMSDNAGMINLSHFAIYDVVGADAERFLEYLSVARVGGDTPDGKVVYTQFLDWYGGIRADITITRLSRNHYRVISGGDTGHRDFIWMRNFRDDHGYDAEIRDLTESIATLGLWGPKARDLLCSLLDEPERVADANFAFGTALDFEVLGVPLKALRISYVGELGWELHFPFPYGLRLWDALFEAGAIPVGIETYASSRRLEKGFRLQNTDLETEYNLCEAGLARPKVKRMDFVGKEAYVEQRARDEQPAYLGTLTMDDNVDANGVARYPVGHWPLLDPETREPLVDSQGRRAYTTSAAYGPSVGKHLLMAYVPHSHAETGRKLLVEYFGEHYPVTLETFSDALYDPTQARVRA